MTTVQTIEVQCSICGESSTQVVIGSTNQMGSPDLDTRPPEMARSTIRHNIQRCTSCNYCSSDLSKCEAGTDEITSSAEYLEIVRDFREKNVSALFLADSLISEKQNNYAGAFWSALHAAWLCDDEGRTEIAAKSRTRALDLLSRATQESVEISDQKGAAELIALDLMRRTKKVDEARELIASIEQTEFEDIILEIARFQGELITQRDVQAHTISEAIESQHSTGKFEYQFWLAEAFGLVRQRSNSEGLWHPEVWRGGSWHRGSSYVMDAITGMGEDPWSCGEYAADLTRDEAQKYAGAHEIDLFADIVEDEA